MALRDTRVESGANAWTGIDPVAAYGKGGVQQPGERAIGVGLTLTMPDQDEAAMRRWSGETAKQALGSVHGQSRRMPG